MDCFVASLLAMTKRKARFTLSWLRSLMVRRRFFGALSNHQALTVSKAAILRDARSSG
jgi:hypothetical protein